GGARSTGRQGPIGATAASCSQCGWERRTAASSASQGSGLRGAAGSGGSVIQVDGSPFRLGRGASIVADAWTEGSGRGGGASTKRSGSVRGCTRTGGGREKEASS